jgi:fructose-bisphosphate aldolase class I
MANQEQMDLIKSGKGFIAALDQSGGSTPKTLGAYGIESSTYTSKSEMYNLIHEMRTRISRSPNFTGKKVIGAILFEDTMDREFGGKQAPTYLWRQRGVVPFLKVDKGLLDKVDHVQLMKPMPGLDALLIRAKNLAVFGTKMRSVIHAANHNGIRKIVEQQFKVGAQITAHGLMPILEPEIIITISDKKDAETILHAALLEALDKLPSNQRVILKLTLPEVDNHYSELCQHPRVLSVVALSGGYSRSEAIARLTKNTSMIASFSRALTEGLTAQQSDAEFDQALSQTIDGIYQASISG